ncbi:MAG: zf-TFIIB domain-containing protein [Breznakibacter sp.]
MKCPVCKDVSLVMSERQGIEIDYCPDCRGVWLDRGELDKIIERAAKPGPTSSPEVSQPSAYRGSTHSYKSHKKHWLGELFD